MKYKLNLVFVLIFTGCINTGSANSASTKPLFASWASTEQSFDLTGGQLGVSLATEIHFANGARCIVDVTLTGTNDSGTICFANGADIPSYPGYACTSALANYCPTYTKEQARLVLYDGSQYFYHN